MTDDLTTDSSVDSALIVGVLPARADDSSRSVAEVPHVQCGNLWLAGQRGGDLDSEPGKGLSERTPNTGNGNCLAHTALHALGRVPLCTELPPEGLVRGMRLEMLDWVVSLVTLSRFGSYRDFMAATPMEQICAAQDYARSQLLGKFLDLPAACKRHSVDWLRALVQDAADRALTWARWLPLTWAAFLADTANARVTVWRPAKHRVRRHAHIALPNIGGEREVQQDQAASARQDFAVFMPATVPAGVTTRRIDILYFAAAEPHSYTWWEDGSGAAPNHFELLVVPKPRLRSQSGTGAARSCGGACADVDPAGATGDRSLCESDGASDSDRDGASGSDHGASESDLEQDAPTPALGGECGALACHLCLKAVSIPAAGDRNQSAASRFAQHQRARHSGQVQARKFMVAHNKQPWLSQLWCCDLCGLCYVKASKGRHERESKRHASAVRKAQAPTSGATPSESEPAGATAPSASVVSAAPCDCAPEYQWDLRAGTALRVALDKLTLVDCISHGCSVVQRVPRAQLVGFTKAISFVLSGLLRSSEACFDASTGAPGSDAGDVDLPALQSQSAAWAKLWQLAPMLLLVRDGRMSRARRICHFACGDIGVLISGLMAFSRQRALRLHTQESMDSLRARVSCLARNTGGLSKAAKALSEGPNTSSPRTEATLEKLRLKHPPGTARADLEAAQERGWGILNAKRAALGLDADGLAALRPWTASPTGVRDGIMSSSAGTAPGLSGLSILHLQQIVRYGQGLREKLLQDLARLGTAAFAEHDALPPEFWYFYSAARLSALGEKARPIACGDTLRRLFGRMYCRSRGKRFAALFGEVGQFGVAVPGGVERVATLARMIHEANGFVLPIDSVNAFNSVDRAAILPEAAAHAGDAYAYITRFYGAGREAALVFGLDGHEQPGIIPSCQGVQQGDAMGPLLFSLALLPILRDFALAFPDLALPAYLDDLVLMALGCAAHGSRTIELDLERLGRALAWLKDRLRKVGLEVNFDKTHCLLPADATTRLADSAGSGATGDAEAQLCSLVRKHLRISPSSERAGEASSPEARDKDLLITGVPIGRPDLVRSAARRILQSRETMALASEIARCEDTQMAYTLLRMCLVPRASFLARNLGPAQADDVLRRFHATCVAALAAVMQEGTLSDADSHVPDWEAAMQFIWRDGWDGSAPTAFTPLALAQIVLPISKGGLGIQSYPEHNAAAFLARTASTLAPCLRCLPVPMRAVLTDSLPSLPLMAELRDCYSKLVSVGFSTERLEELLPFGWPQFAASGDCSALLAAVGAPPAVHGATSAGVPAAATTMGAVAVATTGTAAAAATTNATAAAAATLGAATAAAPSLGPGAPGAVVTAFGNIVADSAVPSVKRVQAALSRGINELNRVRLNTAAGALPGDAADFHQARLLSTQGVGAVACLAAPPSHNRLYSVRSAPMRETLRRVLGIERAPVPGGLCCCGAEQSGEHARSCSKTGEQNYRHQVLQDTLRDMIKQDLHLRVDKESVEGFRARALTEHVERVKASNGKTKAMDLVISPGPMRMPKPRNKHGAQVVVSSPIGDAAKGACIDVSITDPTGKAVRKKAAKTAGYAAARRTEDKFKTYLDSGLLDFASYTLFPLVVEQLGYVSPHGQDLMKAAAAYQCLLSGGAMTEAHCLQRWRQRISIAVHTATSDSVARLWMRMTARAGSPAPDIAAFERVRLLLRGSPLNGDATSGPPAGQTVELNPIAAGAGSSAARALSSDGRARGISGVDTQAGQNAAAPRSVQDNSHVASRSPQL